ncbi:Helix-turn-helix domain-containing protein [Spironucleus salmonicida]|uniref:Helix-turn-helix domain-containing protein n=1 Tax=Spironucleus salmonicida TaxID=348837 RepID=V6LCJ6_9EUKA|nr:Helix-turn-helix domain-containing protein [Spironucleus salmonicida]|eukprot:EST41978.1 hypothetical protein SS50377_18283 [Spironucleus salmonicida]
MPPHKAQTLDADLSKFQDSRTVRVGQKSFPKNNNAQKQPAAGLIVDTTDDMVFGTKIKDNKLGQNFARVRGEAGISRKDLALKIASNEKIIANWENGSSDIPKAMISRLEAIVGKFTQ